MECYDENNDGFNEAILTKILATCRIYPSSPHFEDCKSEAWLAIVKAKTSYNKAVNVKFRSYAYFRARGAVLDYFRRFLGRNYDRPPLVSLSEFADVDFRHQAKNFQELPKNTVARAISFAGLSALEKSIFNWSVNHSKSHKFIGKRFNISPQKSKRLKASALAKIRAVLEHI